MHDVSMFIQQSTSIHHLQNSACTGKYWVPLHYYFFPMCACPDGVKQCLCVPMYVCQPAKCFKQAFTDLILKAKQIILGHSVPNTNACHYFSSSLFKFIGFLTPPLSKSHVIVNSCHVLSHPSHTHTYSTGYTFSVSIVQWSYVWMMMWILSLPSLLKKLTHNTAPVTLPCPYSDHYVSWSNWHCMYRMIIYTVFLSGVV